MRRLLRWYQHPAVVTVKGMQVDLQVCMHSKQHRNIQLHGPKTSDHSIEPKIEVVQSDVAVVTSEAICRQLRVHT